ncbi:collagen alpha-6(VI) chain-like isoform X2 [Pristis pectinata]|uniref:collagen alpha-6(VI) chain-like isoform X2 n=1 Tax=Pristis pectinata TaxID=685728 RepID=UPI00223E717F|nr:collagen alpha-6(VI) chain-like isoform X2 [Pristis pectinata]
MGNFEAVLTVLLFAMSLPSTNSQQTACRNATVADIVLVIDGSSSISDEDFRNIKKFLYAFVNGLDIARNKVKIGLVQYSYDSKTEFLLNEYLSKKSILDKIQNVSQMMGGTNMTKALELLQKEHFVPSAGSRAAEGVKQIAILITDGGSITMAAKEATKLRNSNVTIYVIGVNVASEKELQLISSRPPQKYVYNIANFNKLLEISSKVLESVCTAVVDHIQAFAMRYADVVFLVDSSQNVGPTGFQQIRNFIFRAVSQYEIGADKFQVGLAQYSINVKTEFLLNAYQTNAQVANYIRSPRKFAFQGGRGLRTGNAINNLGEIFFRESAGCRQAQGVPQIAVILASEPSLDDVTLAARVIKSKGVKIISIGVKNANQSELKEIASDYGAALLISDFRRLPEVWDQIDKVITQMIQNEFLARQLERPEACKTASVADVVFLVDASDDIGAVNFQLLRAFLQDIIYTMDIETEKVRIGLAQYSTGPTEEFNLKSYRHKSDILDHIRLIPYKGGGRMTGTAIKFVQKNYFTEQAGSRAKKGIPQALVLITSGESQDKVDSADALRRKGVTIYALGIGNATIRELEKIASYPPKRYVSRVEDFTLLSLTVDTFLKRICNNIITQVSVTSVLDDNLVQGCAETEQADIYFLIDGSSSISRVDFKDMQKFLIGVVNVLSIGADQVRVGVVQYSTDTKIEFEVTQHINKTSLEKAIRGISQLMGKTGTGRALSRMKNLFSEAAKSRGNTVQRFLITITDGKSDDDVEIPANYLIQQGITSYAIGVGEADETELQRIGGGAKERVYFVTNFDALKDIKNSIVQRICSEEACRRMDQSDIIFLIDGSGSIYPNDFMKMKEFMHSIVNKTTIGPEHVRIGLIQFGSTPNPEFQLDGYSSKVDLYNAINNMQQLGGGTLTGQALNFAEDYFAVSKGGRAGIPQYLIVITDGEAQDEVLSPATAIRDKGVIVFAVGVFNANRSQLQEIGGAQDKVYFVENFKLLEDLDQQIFWEICSHPETCLKTDGADIVFMINGSSNTEPDEFERMKSFMTAMVNSSIISSSNVQFGAILYSDSPDVQFQLNQFRSKRDILKAINQMQLGEEAAYITFDLKQARQLLESGGRRSKSISQFIIVMANTEATNSLKESLLADTGESEVTVFTMSPSRNSEEALLGIRDTDKKQFIFQSFGTMGDLITKISQLICDKTNPECDLQQADIVFLMDGSGSISPKDFDLMKSFLSNQIGMFTVNSTKIQIGLAQFSSHFQKVADLNDFSTKKPLLAKIEELVQLKEGTRIGLALTNSAPMFTKEAGSRKASGVRQFLLVFTDGMSQDDVVLPAERLRQDDINIFAVGIGQVDNNQLLQISGSNENVFYVEKFEHLNKIKRRIVRSLCKDRPPPVCSIDIAMGLDLSNQVELLNAPGSQQKLQMHLNGIIERMMDLRNISCKSGQGLATRMGFHKSALALDLEFKKYDFGEVRKELQLQMENQVTLKADYLQSFSGMLQQNAEANVKVILMFTDGIDDDIEKLKEVSERLRLNADAHALIFVPLEEIENADKLAELEFGRGFGYRKKLMINKPDIGNALLSEIDTIAERECCKVYCKCLGQPGRRGFQGQSGFKGNTGRKGFKGYAGEDGYVGNRGAPGIMGAQGENGCQGPKGPKGSRGYRGEKGDKAADGLDGINGEEGEPGIPGVSGEKGPDGNTGSKGVRGSKGERGDPGLPGDPGVPGIDNYFRGRKGDKGQRGIQGEFGTSGRPGTVGSDGSRGRPGRRGIVGRKGRKGQIGITGTIGPPGFQGPQGSKGSFGSPGTRGERGLPGAQGSAGSEGFLGPKGSDGFKGQKGEDGYLGQKGRIGRTGPRGLQGMDGIDGMGIPGPKGRQGDQGFPGYPGSQGQDGVPGTSGGRGPKGIRGRRGNSGQPGVSGSPGERGNPGTRGLKGPPGTTPMKPCELLSYIRSNCPCCSSKSSECPVYPLDLVFALDSSSGVTPVMFNRMKRMVIDFVQDLKITESTCLEGARVAVLTYSSMPKMFIRFSEYRRKKKLLEALQNLAYERSANRQDIGTAMKFVARNAFKHARGGILARKVAVFITSGPTQHKSAIMTAALEFSALDITPVVISFAEVPDIQLAFQVDDTSKFQVALLSRQQREAQEQLRTIQLCTFCFDMCQPRAQCQQVISPPPISINMDMAFVVDGSHNMKMMDFERIKYFLISMLDMFVISRSPRTPDNRARVALVQHSPAGYLPSAGQKPVSLEFGFLKYNNKNMMKRHIKELFNKLDGPSGIGHAIEWTINNVFTRGPGARRYKVIFIILAGETGDFDMEKLRMVSQEARCKGFVIFTVFLGKETGRNNLEETVSFPFDQHLIHIGQLLDSEMTYVERFTRAFLKSLTLEINDYPSPYLERECQYESEISVYVEKETILENYEDEEESAAYAQGTITERQENVYHDGGEFEVSAREVEAESQANTHHDICSLRQDMGSCQDYELKWHFDQSLKSCKQFWYGGCDGNENRFNTLDDCEEICLISH